MNFSLPSENPEAAIPSLSLRLLGTFVLAVRGQSALSLSRSSCALLALLALRGSSRGLGRESVAALLWPNSDDEAARYNLRRTLTEVRTALGGEAARLVAPLNTPRTLRLDLSPNAYCDAIAFDALISRGDEAALEAAIALYIEGGSLLDGLRGDWVTADRERMRLSYLEARERLAEQYHAQGNVSAAIGHLRGILTTEPTRETAVRELMRMLHESGQSAAASAVYRTLRARLRETVAIPDAETTALYKRLQGEARRSRASVNSKNTAGGMSARLRKTLPRPLTALIGRSRDCVEVVGLFRDTKDKSSSRLVTLTGAGGVGKTTLAIAVAEQMLPSYPEGVYFVDLAPLSDPVQVLPLLARTLDLRDNIRRPNDLLVERIVEKLRTGRCLLLLDNAEHLGIDVSRITRTLLHDCPRLTVLATSREPLRVPGEILWRVPGLAQDEAANLFLLRATEADSTFQPQMAQNEPVKDIVRRLAGIPLAIEMAAARVRALSVAEIAVRLDDVFRLLALPGGDLLPRHQTLRATLDWSYALLSSTERILLMHLSVFAGGWTLSAAEEICTQAETDILAPLSSLVEKSLVVFHREANGEGRYKFLETVRQYACEKLSASGQEERLQFQHAEYYCALAKTTRNKLYGAEQEVWLSQLEAGYDNFRAAISFCLREPGELALSITTELYSYWLRSGRVTEGRQLLDAALQSSQSADVSPSSLLRADALDAIGVLAGEQGDFSAAIAYHSEALTLFRQLKEPDKMAAALNHLGVRHQDRGEIDTADELLAEAESIMRAMKNRGGLGNVLSNRGIVAYYRSDDKAAYALISEALELFRIDGDKRRIAHLTSSLGVIAQRQNDLETARRLYSESLSEHRSLGDRQGIGNALYNIGLLHFTEGKYGEARACWRESLAARWEIRYQFDVYESLDALGELSYVEKNYRDAVLLWAAGETLRLATGGKVTTEHLPERKTMIDVSITELGEAEFAGAWARGASWSNEAAVRFAMAL